MDSDLRWWRREFWLGDTDARPAGLMRIGVSLVILLTLCERALDLRELFTDEGLVPSGGPAPSWINLFALPGGGSFAFAATIFALTAVATMLLAVGWRTRWVTPVVWVLVVSTQVRDILVLQGGDTLIRTLLFWAMFSDWGAAYSLDARRGRGATRIWALPVRLLTLQALAVYAAAAAYKWASPDWRNGDALYYILQGRNFVRPASQVLLDSPLFCRLGTWATLVGETAAPLLFLVPLRGARVLLVGTILAMHLTFFAAMRLSVSWLTSFAAAGVLVLPSWLAALRDERRSTWPPARPVITVAFVPFIVTALFSNLQRNDWTIRLATRVGLRQKWTMFVDVVKSVRTMSAIGRLSDGTTREILADAAPELIERGGVMYRSWYHVRSIVSYEDSNVTVWLCRRWDRRGGARLVDVTWVSTVTPARPPDGAAVKAPVETRGPVQRCPSAD
jgi:hypothetical protein